MTLKNYGVLKGHVVDTLAETSLDTPHYQVHVKANGKDYRLAINVRSQEAPSELLFLVDENFQHPILPSLTALNEGFTELPSKAGGMALDYIRYNLFDHTKMRSLPHNLPGPDNDLEDILGLYVKRAQTSAGALIYTFGEPWGPETAADKIFHFKPGNGVHDIHMNQGSLPGSSFVKYDGVWQDGSVLIYFPTTNQWVAIFLAFQSQAWHTDDVTGRALVEPTPSPTPAPTPTQPDGLVRIVAALVNPIGPAPEKETVTLLNTSPNSIDLVGWQIADRMKNKQTLTGKIAAGATMVIKLQPTVQLGNKGGIITLLDAKGLKVDGVSYTGDQANNEGWTIVF